MSDVVVIINDAADNKDTVIMDELHDVVKEGDVVLNDVIAKEAVQVSNDVSERADEVAEKVVEKVDEVVEKVDEVVGEVVEKVDEVVGEVVEKVDEVVGEVVGEVDEVVGEVDEIVEDADEIVEKRVDKVVPHAVDTNVARVVKTTAALILESALTNRQKDLALQVYVRTKLTVSKILSDTTLDTVLKITKIIGEVIKQLEITRVDDKLQSGADKKLVALMITRCMLDECMYDNTIEELLRVYDAVGESVLETLIGVSKVVNVAVEAVTTKCCPGLWALLTHN